jgi:hypothetical protein
MENDETEEQIKRLKEILKDTPRSEVNQQYMEEMSEFNIPHMPPKRTTHFKMIMTCTDCDKAAKTQRHFKIEHTEINLCKKCAEKRGKDWEKDCL